MAKASTLLFVEELDLREAKMRGKEAREGRKRKDEERDTSETPGLELEE